MAQRFLEPCRCALLLAAACSFPTSNGGDPLTDAASDASPDGAAEADASVDALIAQCNGDVLVTSDGESLCELGCAPLPAPHCRRMVPSNALSWSGAEEATADLIVEQQVSFNGETGEILVQLDDTEIRDGGEGVSRGISFRQAMLPDGRVVGVFGLRSLDMAVPRESGIMVIGSRPVAILVDTDATIDGSLDASGRSDLAGSGGDSGGVEGQPGQGCIAAAASGGGGAATGRAGAGGAGHATDGGGGGRSSPAEPGDAGAECLLPADDALLGGSAGGGAVSARGGGGGGALQVSVKGMLRVLGTTPGGSCDAWISVSGGGGEGISAGTMSGGAGGGAGGTLILEAATLQLIDANLTANGGGGGGSGATSNARDGRDGAYCDDAAAAGGGSIGGSGGALNTPPSAGRNANGNGSAGGGGAAAGRIIIRSLSDVVIANGVISPELTSLPPAIE